MRAMLVWSVALLPFVTPQVVLGQGSDSVITINVQRSARLPADRVIAYVSLETTAESARDAVARLGSVVTTVVEALSRAESVQVGAPVMLSVGNNPALGGYPAAQLPMSRTARASIKLTSARSQALVQAAAIALDAGARAVSTITVESSHADSARVTLMREAVAAARDEAAALAKELGGRLGPLLGAGTTSGPMFPQAAMVQFDGGYGGSMPLSEVQVSLNVNVRFRLLR